MEMASFVLNKKLSHSHVMGACKSPSYWPLAESSRLQTRSLGKNCFHFCQLRVNQKIRLLNVYALEISLLLSITRGISAGIFLGLTFAFYCLSAQVRERNGTKSHIHFQTAYRNIDSICSFAFNQHSCESECDCSVIDASNY